MLTPIAGLISTLCLIGCAHCHALGAYCTVLVLLVVMVWLWMFRTGFLFALAECGFVRPSAIQKMALPIICGGADCVVWDIYLDFKD